MTSRCTLLLAFALTSAACDEQPETAEAESRQTSEVGSETSAEGSAEASATRESERPLEEPTRGDRASENEARENEAREDEAREDGTRPEVEAQPDPEAMLERAREAATAAETGSTYCESAYSSLRAMQAQVAAQYPDQVRPMPEESAFTAVCEDLPVAAQRCLIPRHAMENASQCERTAAALPPNLRQALEDVLGG